MPTSNLTPRSIQRIAQKYARISGFEKKITPQTLRNYLGARLLSQGMDEREVQTRLGHESIVTTRKYGLT